MNSLITGVVDNVGWTSGGMIATTGVEFADANRAKTSFIAVTPGERMQLISDGTNIELGIITVWEFTTNQKTTASTNNRIRYYSTALKKDVIVPDGVNYLRFQVNAPLDSIKDHLTVLHLDTATQYSQQYSISRFSGKKISIIGDSIDTFNQVGYKIDGYNMYYPTLDVTDVNDTWWMQVIRASGASLEVNASWSGSRVTNTHSNTSYPDFYQRINVVGDPDLIFIALGVNDSTNNVAFGEYDFTTNYQHLSESEFRPAYIKGIKGLQALHPNAEIVCIAEKMGVNYKQSVEYIAKTLGCGFIDASDYVGASGVHPGKLGMHQIASQILYPTDFMLTERHIPADGAIVGEMRDTLNEELGDLETRGIGRLHGEFFNASLASGEVIFNIGTRTRVTSYKKFIFPYDITLTPDPGYKIGVHSFGTNGEAFVSDSGWRTEPYTVPANTYFRIVIYTVPDSTADADVYKFVNAVKVTTVVSHIQNEINTLQENTTEMISSIGSIKSITPVKITGLNYPANGTAYVASTAHNVDYIHVIPGNIYHITLSSTSTTSDCYFRRIFTTVVPTQGISGVYINEKSTRKGNGEVIYIDYRPNTEGYLGIAHSNSSSIGASVLITESEGVSAQLYEQNLIIEANNQDMYYLTADEFEQGTFYAGKLYPANSDCITQKNFHACGQNAKKILLNIQDPTGTWKSRVSFFDKNTEFLSDTGAYGFFTEFSIPENAVYYRLSVSKYENNVGVHTSPNSIAANTIGVKLYFKTLEYIEDAYIKRSVSGSVLHIRDAAVFPLDGLVLRITPTQAGSGTPSSSNVRPITGKTQVSILHTTTFNGTQPVYSFNLPSAVYGGTLDVLSGKLISNYTNFSATDASNITSISTNSNHIRCWLYFPGKQIADAIIYSDKLSYAASSAWTDYSYYTNSSYPNSMPITLPYGGTNGVQTNTVASIQAWLAAHPIQIVAPLTTAPAAVSVASFAISAYSGENYISTTDGTLECTYKADPTLSLNENIGIPDGMTKYVYTGERIEPQQYHVAQKYLYTLPITWSMTGESDGKNRTRQGATVYNDTMFMCTNGFEHIMMYDLRNGSTIYDIHPYSTYQENCHCNNINFGIEKYNDNDPFPLAYISLEDTATRKCEVLRIIKTNNTYSATRVQQIFFPPLSEDPIYYTNSYIDVENGYLYISGYTTNSFYQSATNKIKIERYTLPKLSDGATVQLAYTNRLNEFTIDSYTATQGAYIQNNKMYQAGGYGDTDNWIHVIDLNEGKVVTNISLNNMGITQEPEAAFMWDEHLCFYTVYGQFYKLYFD